MFCLNDKIFNKRGLVVGPSGVQSVLFFIEIEFQTKGNEVLNRFSGTAFQLEVCGMATASEFCCDPSGILQR